MTVEIKQFDKIEIFRVPSGLAIAFGTWSLCVVGLAVLASTGREVDPGRQYEDIAEALAQTNQQIEFLSTAIDNGDVDGTFSTAGATIELLVDRRDALIAQLNEREIQR